MKKIYYVIYSFTHSCIIMMRDIINRKIKKIAENTQKRIYLDLLRQLSKMQKERALLSAELEQRKKYPMQYHKYEKQLYTVLNDDIKQRIQGIDEELIVLTSFISELEKSININIADCDNLIKRKK